LISNKVEFLLVGGYAVAYHGYPRATVGMDIWIERSEENADRMMRVLGEFGFKNAGMQRDWLLAKTKVSRLGVEPNRIEVLTEIDGVEFSSCKENAVQGEIDGIPIPIIALDDLKTNKKASGRYKDLNDIAHLP